MTFDVSNVTRIFCSSHHCNVLKLRVCWTTSACQDAEGVCGGSYFFAEVLVGHYDHVGRISDRRGGAADVGEDDFCDQDVSGVQIKHLAQPAETSDRKALQARRDPDETDVRGQERPFDPLTLWTSGIYALLLCF